MTSRQGGGEVTDTRTVLRRRLTSAFWILLLAWIAVIGLAFVGVGGRDSPLSSISTAFSFLIPALALVILGLWRRSDGASAQ